MSRNYQIPNMWISLMEDFRAKTSALQEVVWVSTEAALDYGVRCIELYGKLDLDMSSLRTAQLSFFEDSNGSYAIFPKSGMMRNGNVYRMPTLVSTIAGRGCTLLPTPTKSNDKRGGFKSGTKLKAYLSRQMTKEGHVYFIIHVEGEPVGYVSVRPEDAVVFHLEKIYVLPDFQGGHCGSALFRHAVAYVRRVCPEARAIELNVNRQNPALGFYRRMGMRIDREGDFDIGNGFYMNDYIMRLEL